MRTLKKSILPLLLLLTASISAQNGDKCYDENTHIINLGVGLGRAYYSGVYAGATYVNTPAFSLSYEQPIKKKLGPGYLGVGAYFGYQHASYRYDLAYNKGIYFYEHSWNYMMIAARAAYHWDVLTFRHGDIYAGALLGLRIQTYSYSTNDPDPVNANYYRLNNGSVYPSLSVFAGARWWFAKNFGLFAEAGYGISYLTGGLSIKF